MMDIILLKNHPELYKHLANRGVRAIDYAWLWMSTALKTVSQDLNLNFTHHQSNLFFSRLLTQVSG